MSGILSKKTFFATTSQYWKDCNEYSQKQIAYR